MSAKVTSKRAVPNAPLKKDITKVSDQKKDIKQCLKLLMNGQLELADIDGIVDEFMAKPHLGDHIQYELHKYCQQDKSQVNSSVVVKLVELCYSAISVIKFSNIDRFVGCAYYISSFLLKRDKHEAALSVICSLGIKKDEILQTSKEKPDVRTFLCSIHSSFIASAIGLASGLRSHTEANYKISHSLAMESLKVFSFTNMEQTEVGRKLLKTSTLYLQTIKHYRDEDVFEFYRALNEALRMLMPRMGDVDFCFYYLSSVNQQRRSDSEEEAQAVLRKSIHLLTLFLNSSVQVRHSLSKILEFFFGGGCEGDWISGEDFEVLNRNQSCSQLYFLLVSSAFSIGVQFLWKKYEENWSECISSDLVKNISNSLLHFHRFHCRSKAFYCSSGKEPYESCFGNLLTGNLQKIQYTIRLCLKHRVPNALSLVPVSRDAFRLSMECLEYMESRGCCEEQRIYCWKFSVIHHTNTVEDVCRYGASEETWLLLKECSQEILREVIRSKAELPFDYRRITILFQRWHTSSLRLKNYRDALYACVVYYVFYPREEKEIMSMWLQAKSESCNEIIEEMTMSEIIKTCEGSLREFSPTYDSSKIILKAVLMMELKSYSTCPPDIFQNPNTTYQLATRIWKQLEKSRLDVWETSLALSSLISANTAGDNKKLPNGLLEKCKRLVDELMNWRGKTQGRSLLHAANLTLSLFLYNVKLAESSEGKMDTSYLILDYLKKAEEEKVKFGEDVDLNLSCDVIPSSTHLTVALETNYLNELNKIVDMWNNALKTHFEDLPSPMEFDLWQRNVKQVANLYKLFGEYRRAFTTWLMVYRVGKLCDNPAAVLLGLSHLIESCADVDESGVKEEAELISGKLGSEASEKHVVVEYTLAVASNYLRNRKTERCLEYLSIAKKILESLRTSVMTHALNAKFWCLVSRFLVLHKEYEAVFDYPPGTDVRVMAFNAFGYANAAGRSDLIKTAAQSECMELVLAMLDVNLWAYHLFGVYRQTDFMRFFLDDLYQIVQRLFLPTRTAEILVRLAEVDLICEKLEDCQGKITKLKSILTTMSSRCGEGIKREKPPHPYLPVPEKGDFDVPSPRPVSPARFLDKPHSKELQLSPFHYYSSDPKPSDSAEHLGKCKCRLCQNLLVQTLTFNTIWLEAEMCGLGGSPKQAARCYGQGFDMLGRVELLRAEQSQMLRVELAAVLKEVPGELDFLVAPVQFLSARFLIKHALFEASHLRAVTENVMKTMLRVSTLMNRFSYERKLLQWAFAELKLVCVVLGKGDAKPPRKSVTPIQFKATAVTKTPFVGAAAAAPPNEKNSGKAGKARDPCAVARKKEDISDPMNTAFVGADDMHTVRKYIQPRKLVFGTTEPEASTKTVRKAPQERALIPQPRRLDFDESGDMFEETEKSEAKENPGEKMSLRTRSNKPPPGKPRREVKAEGVKVYVDTKDSKKKTATRGARG